MVMKWRRLAMMESSAIRSSLQPLVLDILSHLLDLLCVELVHVLGESNDV